MSESQLRYTVVPASPVWASPILLLTVASSGIRCTRTSTQVGKPLTEHRPSISQQEQFLLNTLYLDMYVKYTLETATKAQRWNRYTYLLLLLTSAPDWVWVFKAIPRRLCPMEWPGTHYVWGWVGPRTGLDGCGKFRLTGIGSPDLPARSGLLYRLSYPGPLFACRLRTCKTFTTHNTLNWFISTSPANIYLPLRCDKYICLSQEYILLLLINEPKNSRFSTAIRRRAAATVTDPRKRK
jgi:hypothetical protein